MNRPWFRAPAITAAAQPDQRAGDESTVKSAMGRLYHERGGSVGPDKTNVTEQEIVELYRGEPGIFRALVDLEADRVSGLEFRVATMDGGDAPEAVSAMFWRTFRGPDPTDTPKALIHRATLLMRLTGRFAVVFTDTADGLAAWVTHPQALEKENRAGVNGYRVGRKLEASNPDKPNQLWVPERQVRELWLPDPFDPLRPWTPYFGAVEPLRNLRGVARRVMREVNAWLAGDRLLHFEGSPEQLARRSPDGTVTQTPMGEAISGLYEVMAGNLRDRTESEVRTATIIPFVSTVVPSVIELARQIDPNLVTLWHEAATAFAQATPWPTLWVTDGTGAGNRWSEFLQDQQKLSDVVYPVAEKVGQLLTAGVLRPVLAAAKIPDGHRYQLVYEPADDEQQGLSAEQAHQAWTDGLISRARYAEALGVAEDDLLELPAGMTEFELWAAARGDAALTPQDVSAWTVNQPAVPTNQPATASAGAWWEIPDERNTP